MSTTDGLEQVMREVSGFLDGTPLISGDADIAPEKFRKILEEQGKASAGTYARRMPACAGSYHGRPVSVSLHRGSEMTIRVQCSSPCRFRVVRSTLGARLNFLQGRRIRSGISALDRDHVIRAMGGCDLERFFQRTDVASFMQGLLPFFSLECEPGSVTHASDFKGDAIRSDLVTARLEATAGLAGMLEEAFADETAVERIKDERLERGGGMRGMSCPARQMPSRFHLRVKVSMMTTDRIMKSGPPTLL